MDKNTVTGLVLIAAIVIGFTIFTRPSQEEIDKQKRYQDSIALVQQNQINQDLTEANVKDQSSKVDTGINDFFAAPAATTQTTSNDSLATDGVTGVDSVANLSQLEEKIVSLENEKIKIDFTTRGGHILSTQLKEYQTYQDDSLYLTKGDGGFSLELMNKKGITLNTANAIFTVLQGNTAQTLVMRMNYTADQYVDFIYTLAPDSYMVKFDLAVVGMQDVLSRESVNELKVNWSQKLRRQEKSEQNEQRYSRIAYKNIEGSVEELSESKDEKLEVAVPLKWVAFKDQFFASTIIADNDFSIAQLNSKMINSSADYLKDYSASLFFKPEVDNNGTIKAGFKYFVGPLDYYMLKDYDEGITNNADRLDLDRLIPLGWSLFRLVNQYFIIPLFNLLGDTGIQMGLVILFLTLIVKIILSPLTYKSFMSSAKMRALKPQVEEINDKYPGQEKAMDRQKATMALYRQAGVNPMSGCIPMLLQMPILLALFSFFPSAIELRHQSFLWAHDLSTYDAIIEWNSNIPLISSWLGNHISLFCLLMTATNIIYTKFNMDATNTGQQQMPGMKWMMMFMPLIFFFVLNNYPSGLTYYYFLSTLMTILITLAFRYFVDEKKVLAKLEENKKKPKKQGFMARLQEQAEQAQRMQQQQAKKGKKK